MSRSIAKRLRALLDGDALEEGIVASRNDQINKAHYARLLSVSTSLLGQQPYRNILSEYEAKYQIATGPLAKLGAMHAWLEKAYRSGELGLRDGRIDRQACMQHFELAGGTALTRFPQIRELFDSFDHRAAADDYIPLARRIELEKVKQWLLKPVLNSDRLTVNRPALTQFAGIEIGRLQDRHFLMAIEACEKRIRDKATRSEIDPYFHDRVFPFSALLNLWPRAFIEKIGARFKIAFAGLAPDSVKRIYLVLFATLEWIGQSTDHYCRTVIADTRTTGDVRNSRAWEDSVYAFREVLVSKQNLGGTTISADAKIKALRLALEALGSNLIVPKLSAALPGIKHARRRSTHHLKSVAEALPKRSATPVDPYVQFAQIQFGHACRSTGSESDRGELQGFLSGIAEELRHVTSLPPDPSTAILQVLNRRLGTLKDAANAIVQTARAKLDLGRQLLGLADIDPRDFEMKYTGADLNRYDRITLVRKYFPFPMEVTEGTRERSIGNLLKIIVNNFGGAPPSAHTPIPGYGQFLQKRYLELGGLRYLEGLLLPDADAVGAVLTLYLCEAGANVSVGRTLDRQCITESDVPGFSRITGHKARARGKAIYIDLPSDNIAIKAIEWLKSATEPLARRAATDIDRLFLIRVGSRVQLATPHWYTSWFRQFAESKFGDQKISLTPNMLRPSVLLQACLENDGRLQLGQAIGQHSSQVTQGYQQKWPARVLYDTQVRRFQTDLETIIAASIPDAATRLGLREDELQERLAQVGPSGLGTFCLNLKNSSGPRPKQCQTLKCWDDCPNLLIIADVDAIAALQLWQLSLRDAAADWERDHPDRWEAIWLPWLCLADVVEEKMTRGPLIKIWQAASKRAQALKASPTFVPHRPW
ncbi:hypothetical protein [Oryzibacter oryziterrae]|uniref:hypothetical protein n=1 Tax=Oryzibacter oryziterrae TaxID=2766474 RepID=UPI001F357C69|nr:hypothetical protein [Oryzibacter oryziterrae]